MGNKSGQPYNYKFEKLENMKSRYQDFQGSSIQTKDKSTGNKVVIISVEYKESLQILKKKMKKYAEIQQKNSEFMVPIIAWCLEEDTLIYSQPVLLSLSQFPQNNKNGELIRQVLRIWGEAVKDIELIQINFYQHKHHFYAKGAFDPLNQEDKIQKTIFTILGVETYVELKEEINQLYPRIGNSITNELITFFDNRQSFEVTFALIFQAISSEKLKLSQLKAKRLEFTSEFSKQIKQIQLYFDFYLIVLPNKFQVRDLKLQEVQFKNIENIQMVEVIDSKKIAICSINEIALLEKNEKNLFEECYTIKLGNMLINKIKYKNNMIFAYGRTKRNNEYLNQIKAIFLDKNQKAGQTVEKIYPPGSMGFEVLENGKFVISVKQFGYLCKWKISREFKQCQLTSEVYGHEDAINCIIELSDGRIITGGNEGFINLWDYDHSTILSTFQFSSGISLITEIAEKQLVSGHSDGSICFWNIHKELGLQMFYSFKAHDDLITGIINSSNSEGRYILTSALDGIIKIWVMNNQRMN